MLSTRLSGASLWLAIALLMGLLPVAAVAQDDQEPDPMIPSADPQAVIHEIKHSHDRVEMVVNSSRILKLDQKIPKAVVNNPDLLDVTPLSPSEIQIFAKKAGVTQVNIWGEDQKIRSVDVIVFADAQELAMLLKHQFPNATLRVIPLANSVVISGYLDDPDQVGRIIQMAEDFHPKVINNIRIGGVQQVLLHVKVLEVSRTRLRQVGFDFSRFNSGGDFAASGISGLIRSASTQTSAVDAITSNGATITGAGVSTVTFGVMDGASSFFGFLDFLRQYDLMKIMAEPNLVCVSGRPAFFNSGGEFPIIVPQSLGTVSIQYKKYGTQLDFVPIVLGNGNIRLEVKPRVSEIDTTRSVIINNNTVPALKTREAETGVEMQSGQTLAIAGLVYNRQESLNRGIPWLADVPYIGAAFSRKRQEEQEVELLILVTPQLVEPMDCDEVPPGGPGLHSATPNDLQFYLKGHLEVGTDAPLAPGGGAGQYPPHCPAPNGTFGADGASADCQNGNCPVDGVPADGGYAPPTGAPQAVPAPAEEVLPSPMGSGAPTPASARAKKSRAPGNVAQRAPQGQRPAANQRSTANATRKPAAGGQQLREPGTAQASDRKAPRNVTASSVEPSVRPVRDSRPAQTSKSSRPAPQRDVNRVSSKPGFIGSTGYDVRN